MLVPRLFVKKVLPGAVLPTKAHKSDIGYDLTLVAFDKIIYDDDTSQVALFDTGIAVMPEDGYYVEIVPRSSLSKTPYSLANSVGIIDPDYRGTLKIALRMGKDVPSPLLPFKGFQMIVRKTVESEINEVEELNETLRGDGGFGSTGN
jgi:dUTP pyrophosphatase